MLCKRVRQVKSTVSEFIQGEVRQAMALIFFQTIKNQAAVILWNTVEAKPVILTGEADTTSNQRRMPGSLYAVT